MANDEINFSALLEYSSRFATPILAAHSPESSPLVAVQTRPISRRRGKKRSSRACISCRKRKVRCNIVQHGAPCSNCQHDEVGCVLSLSRRQSRAMRSKYGLYLENPLFSLEARDTRQDVVVFDGPRIEHVVEEQRCQDVAQIIKYTLPMPGESLAEVLSTNSISQCPTRSHSPSPHWRVFESELSISWSNLQAPLATASTRPTSSSKGFVPSLPPVFEPLSSHLRETDLIYLHRRDGLTIPSENLQIMLLKAYGKFTHGVMPILDTRVFLEIVKFGGVAGSNTTKLSLLLFQAVLFAGADYVSLKALNEAGYGSRDIARRTLFSRVKLLYDFDTTTSRYAVVQSLILMTLYSPISHSFSKDYKDADHYLSLAISLALSMGINRNLPHANLQRKGLEKRIWWNLYLRDRTLALDLEARPPKVKNEDYNVEMLTLEDFNLQLKETEANGIDAMMERHQALVFIEKLRLCSYHDVPIQNSRHLNDLIPQSIADMIQAGHSQSSLSTESVCSYSESLPASKAAKTAISEANYSDKCCFQPASASSLSLSDECHTPDEGNSYEQIENANSRTKVRWGRSLGAGPCVDGEYDDYLEYFKAF